MNGQLGRPRRPLGIASIGLMTGVLALSACAGDSGGQGGGNGGGGEEIVTVDVAYSTTSVLSAAPFAVAIEEGFFEERGCRLGEQIEEALGGANTLRSVIDGGLDMGEVATNAVIEGFLSGTEITAVGSSHQQPYDVWYAVRKDSGITSIEDLRGMRLGYTSPGSASEDMAYLMPNGAGMEVGEIELVPTNGLGGGIALLEGGDVDATLIIPIIYEQNTETLDIGFESLDYIEGYQKTVYIVSDEFAEQNPDAVTCILGGIDEGMRFIADDPAAAAEIYSEYNEDFTVEQLQQELELAVESGALEGTVGFNPTGLENVALARELRTGEQVEIPWEDIFDPSFLPDGAATELPE